MRKTILYTDGGCAGNEQRDCSKRKMVAVVSNDQGHILIDKHQEGGSNNIAELLAVKEALLWSVANKIGDVEIRTDCEIWLPVRMKPVVYPFSELWVENGEGS